MNKKPERKKAREIRISKKFSENKFKSAFLRYNCQDFRLQQFFVHIFDYLIILHIQPTAYLTARKKYTFLDRLLML